MEAGWAIFVITIFLLGMLYIGYRARGKPTSEEYFVAGRKVGIVATFFGSYFTLQSAFIFMGMGALGYLMGVPAMLIALCGLGHAGIMIFVWPKIWAIGRREGYITQADLLVGRYGAPWFMRLFQPIITTGYVAFGHLMVQMIALGFIFMTVTRGILPMWFGAAYVLLFVVLYVFLGGFRATAWTNVVEGSWAMASLLIITAFFLVKLTAMQGVGLSGLWGLLAAQQPAMINPPGGVGYFQWPMVISWMFIYIFVSSTAPHFMMRAYAARSDKVFPWLGALYAPAHFFFTLFPVLLLGSLSKLVWPTLKAAGVAPDQIIPHIVTEFVPWWLVPILLTGAVAAAISTADGAVLTLSAMYSRDIYKGLLNREASERSVVWVGRVLVVIIAGAVLAVALTAAKGALIVGIATAAYGFIAIMVVPVMLGLYWRRLNTAGAITGMCVALLVHLYITFLAPHDGAMGFLDQAAYFGFQANVWTIISSFVVTVVVSYLTKPPSEVIIKRFFGSKK